MGIGVFIVGFFLGCLAGGVCDGPGCGSTWGDSEYGGDGQ